MTHKRKRIVGGEWSVRGEGCPVVPSVSRQSVVLHFTGITKEVYISDEWEFTFALLATPLSTKAEFYYEFYSGKSFVPCY